MKIVIEISETKYLSLMKCFENDVPLGKTDSAIINGTPLPEGAEILTKEAYSDLCLRASRIPCYLGSPCEYQNEDIKIPHGERKTGHWIEKDGWDGDVYYDCSACGESWITIEGTPWDNDMNYCPHCGAKMEGSKEDAEKL